MIMLIAICITILVRSIVGKNIHSLLEEVNDNIELADSLWIVTKGGEQSVMTSDLETIFPFTKASHFVDRDMLTTVMPDHTILKYTLRGELINTDGSENEEYRSTNIIVSPWCHPASLRAE